MSHCLLSSYSNRGKPEMTSTCCAATTCSQHLVTQPDSSEIVYTAGFAAFPDPVKVACAQLVKNAQATPALNVKKNVAPDGMQFWYFSDSLLDATVQELLAPFVAQRVG